MARLGQSSVKCLASLSSVFSELGEVLVSTAGPEVFFVLGNSDKAPVKLFCRGVGKRSLEALQAQGFNTGQAFCLLPKGR